MVTGFEFGGRRLSALAVVAGALTLFVVAPLAQGASKPPQSGKYLGKTSETSGAPLSFTVSAAGTKITSFTASLSYNGKCGQGGGPTFAFKVPAMTIAKGGHFAATTQGADKATKGTIRITGIIATRSAHGTIVEPKPFVACRAPNQNVNSYSETFTATAG